MKTVFMFSGQGAQYIGMGKELYDNFKVAKDVFDSADSTLSYSIREVCFENESALNETENTQPAILTMSTAVLRVLEEKGIKPDYTAGLSLGEYSALVASGAIDFCDAVSLVKKRGAFMTEAVPLGEGAMYAIMGLENSVVEEICTEVSRDIAYVAPANYNAPGQIVIAGEAKSAEIAADKAKERGSKLTVKLNVSGPFHTKLLSSASEKLEKELEKIEFKDMTIPVITNVTGQILENKFDIAPTLARQVISPVKWEDTIVNLKKLGVDTFIEIGPGKSLCGFVKRTVKDVTILNVEDMKSLDKTLDKLSK